MATKNYSCDRNDDGRVGAILRRRPAVNEPPRSWSLGGRGHQKWLDAKATTYADAGVHRDHGTEAVRRVAEHVRSTFTPSVLSDIGGFAGIMSLTGEAGHGDTLLVASTDGVGTKALLTAAMDKHDTIGLDLVAVNADDIVVYGARPLFLLDFIIVDRVSPHAIERIVRGIAEGCRSAGCVLLGGEVAEHPGTRAPGEFDLAGFVVGTVSRERLITGASIAPGDSILGLFAEGMRSDGYSFVRKIFADRDLNRPAFRGAEHSLGDELCRPARIYTPSIVQLVDAVDVHGLAHVTGGGIATNVERILPGTCDAVLWRGSWPIPPIFDEMRSHSGVTMQALEESLPIGIGMVAMVSAEHSAAAIQALERTGETVFVIGIVTEGVGRAYIRGGNADLGANS